MNNIVSASGEEFSSFVSEWSAELESIALPPDINTQIGTMILSRLDNAYAILRIHYANIESAKDRVDSIIRQKERSMAEGTNEQNRRKHATEYLERYPSNNGEEVDMYEYQRVINKRYLMVKALIDVIENKQQRLITMTGLIKIDSTLGSGNYG